MASSPELVVAHSLPPQVEDLSFGYIESEAANLQVFAAFEASGKSPEMVEAAAFRKAQKEQFLQGDIVNPVLNNCPRFTTEEPKRRAMYYEIRNLLHAQELRKVGGAVATLEDTMLDGVLAQRVNELGYVEAAALVATSDTHRPELAELLKKAGHELYGMPDRNRALSFWKARLDTAHELIGSDDKEVQSISQYVIDHSILPDDFEVLPPVTLDSETIAYYQEILTDECKEAIDYAFAETGIKDDYTPQEMCSIYNRYLDVRGFTEAGWSAEVIPNRTMCATEYGTKTLAIGDKRPAKQLEHKRVLQTLLHEAEIHIGRSVRGAQLGSGLAGIGLKRSIGFEEPLAASTENLYVGEMKQRGEAPLLTMAVSAGYDGTERDFRDSFELQWRLSFMKTYKPGADVSEEITKSQASAYNKLVRIWRGMPTDVPGCIFTNDQWYENSGFVDYIHNDGKLLPRADFLQLLEAKYDPRVPEQAAYIGELTAQRAHERSHE